MNIRYHISVWLFDLAARIYPFHGRMTGQAHHVGNRWLTWKIEAAKFSQSEITSLHSRI